MARFFDGSDDAVTLAVGGLNFAFGPATVAAICRKDGDTGTHTLVWAGVSGTSARWGLFIAGTQPKMRIGLTEVGVGAGLTVSAADGWVLLAATHPSGGTVRFHKYRFSDATWTHLDAGTSSNGSAPATSAFLGATSVPSNFFGGDLGIAAAWNVVLSDAETKLLPFTLGTWRRHNPKGLWLLDQAATTQKILDLTGNGANETALTGTAASASSVPTLSRGAAVALPSGASTLQAADGTANVTSPTAASAAGTKHAAAAVRVSATGTTSTAAARSAAASVAVTAPSEVLVVGAAERPGEVHVASATAVTAQGMKVGQAAAVIVTTDSSVRAAGFKAAAAGAVVTCPSSVTASGAKSTAVTVSLTPGSRVSATGRKAAFGGTLATSPSSVATSGGKVNFGVAHATSQSNVFATTTKGGVAAVRVTSDLLVIVTGTRRRSKRMRLTPGTRDAAGVTPGTRDGDLTLTLSTRQRTTLEAQ
jgi:hypothetical protein